MFEILLLLPIRIVAFVMNMGFSGLAWIYDHCIGGHLQGLKLPRQSYDHKKRALGHPPEQKPPEDTVEF